MINILIADDQAMVRSGLRMILESESDLVVVDEAADGAQAVRIAKRERPDVVLMDVRMPEMDGLEATRLISSESSEIKVIVLTTFDIDEYVYGALRAGASGFLLKDAPADDLVAAIRVVAGGDALLAPSVTRRIIERFAAGPDPESEDVAVATTALDGSAATAPRRSNRSCRRVRRGSLPRGTIPPRAR